MIRIDLESTDSTNTFVKKLCMENLQSEEIYLVTAREQTAGRGRIGRSFSSLKDNGLYMTVAFPVGKKPEECLFITIAAAVVTCELLQECGCRDVRIKWVNDLYLHDRKAAGILTEAVTDPDTGLMRYAVVGLGININTDLDRLPAELHQKAGTITGLSVSTSVLSQKLAERIPQLALQCLDSEEEKKACIEKYRKQSMILGRRVFWEDGGQMLFGIAAGIDEQGRLLVERSGRLQVLDSGDVSLNF